MLAQPKGAEGRRFATFIDTFLTVVSLASLIQGVESAAGDPRPSLEELYGSHDGYVTAITAAARKLQADRLMLQEDVDLFVTEARDSSVLR